LNSSVELPDALGAKGMETLDLSRLLTLLEGDSAAFHEIKKLFFQSVNCQIDSVCRAIESRDLASLVRGAHTIKGACANFGACSMEEMALKMELAAKSEDYGAAGDLVVPLKTELERIRNLVAVAQNE
jgi:HPt (histidine-containing phosphotransfer) domain-containing protein